MALESVKANQDDEIKDILAKCYASTEVLAKTLFPERFTLPFSKSIHSKIFEIIDNPNIKRAAIAAPRGIGKTSIVNLVLPARGILFRDNRYIVPISCSANSAIEQSENLKSELTSNEMILKLFGSCKSNRWAQEQWDTYWPDDPSFSTRVLPRGAGQQVRGRLFRNYRPDLIIIDDLEDPEHMDSPEQRKKKIEWFYADVLNSVLMWSDNWRIIVLGTVLHEDSLLMNLLEDESWNPVRLEICDDNFHSNWPEAYSDEKLKKMYDDFKSKGLADTFGREYRNLPISVVDATFKDSYFHDYDESKEKLDSRSGVEHAVLVDPAKSAQLKSSDSAIVVVAVDTRSNTIYVRDIVSGKFHPDEIYDIALTKAVKYKAAVIGIETAGLNEFIMYPFKNEMIRRGLMFTIHELKPRRGKARGEGKDERIASLLNFYRRGQILHNPEVCSGLEMQLRSFPRSKKKDIMDCLAYIVELLELGDRYFKSMYEDDEDIEKEYEALLEDTEKALEWTPLI